jgi:hypothetical protein
MLKFRVVKSTIRDNLGQYCEPGDMAVLNKKTAEGYLNRDVIKVVLPDFDLDDPVEEAVYDAQDAQDALDENERLLGIRTSLEAEIEELRAKQRTQDELNYATQISSDEDKADAADSSSTEEGVQTSSNDATTADAGIGAAVTAPAGASPRKGRKRAGAD